MSIDAFSRLRVSENSTTYQYYPTPLTGNSSIDRDLLFNSTSGTGNISYNTKNFIDINISANNDKALVQTKSPMDYQPGKSRLLYISGVLLSRAIVSGENLVSKFGMYNTTDYSVTSGTYFQTDGNNLQFGNTTQDNDGNVTTTTVNQSSWNIDVFDGNGPSGKTLTIANANATILIFIEQEWLGVGSIKVGFVIDNILCYVHMFTVSNLLVQYTNNPRQKVSYQISGTVVNSSISNRMMCACCISEGGYIPIGRRNSINTTITGIAVGTIGVKYVLLALKVNSLYNNGILKIIKICCAYEAATNKISCFELQLHTNNVGSITGTQPSFITMTDSIAQYYIGTGSQTINQNGYVLTSGFVNSQSNIYASTNDFETLLYRVNCTQNDGDVMFLVGTGNASSDVMFTSIDFMEII